MIRLGEAIEVYRERQEAVGVALPDPDADTVRLGWFDDQRVRHLLYGFDLDPGELAAAMRQIELQVPRLARELAEGRSAIAPGLWLDGLLTGILAARRADGECDVEDVEP